jgi:hypothetical protein
MAVVYGAYTAYLTDTFFVEQGKAYDLDDPIIGPVVRDVMKKAPDAFRGAPEPAKAPSPEVETATKAPGEVRTMKRPARG